MMAPEERDLARAALRRFATQALTPGELEQEIERTEQERALLATYPPSAIRDNGLALVDARLKNLQVLGSRLVMARVRRAEPPRADFAKARYVDLVGLAELLLATPGRKQGRNYVFPCPLHEDRRTPNLTVFPPGGGWYCFGCGRGGRDAASFVAAVQRVSQVEGLRWVEEFCDIAGETTDAEPALQAA